MSVNGIAYNQTLKIEKKYKSGEYMSGYPKVYSLCDAFDKYPKITVNELKALSLPDYSQRVSDFEQYILEIENIGNLNSVNQALSYAPDICPISSDFAVSIEVITDTDNVVTDKVTSFFSIYDKQFYLPQITAFGNTVVCTTRDLSGNFVFAGWADSSAPDTVISSEKIYEFQISKDTALIAKWRRGNSSVQLVLIAGANISSVSGAGNYASGTLVTVDTVIKAGAAFSGWYKKGILVSTVQIYSFNITEYTELEARASVEEYILAVVPNSAVMIGQGESKQISFISTKNGVFTSVSFDVDSEWITVSGNNSSFTIRVSKNSTGTARSATVTVTQSESGKKVSVNIQQQSIAPDDKYEWVLNDSELKAEIEKGPTGTAIAYIGEYVGTENWNPAVTVPSTSPTYDDYVSKHKANLTTYTVTIKWEVMTWNGAKAVFEKQIQKRTVTIQMWYDATVKN